MSKVIGLVTKPEKKQKEYKQDMLEVLESVKKMIEEDEMTEFIVSGIDPNGEVILAACCKDLVGGVGMLEIAKQSLIQQ
jgi:hypothetical protein